MIIPDPAPETAPFWSAAAEQRFLLHHCPGCGAWLHPQSDFCPCGAGALEWRQASGLATLVSYTVVRHTPVPALDVPFTLVLVRLDEGPQFIASLPGDHHGLRVGMPMRVTYDRVGSATTLPRFVPAETG